MTCRQGSGDFAKKTGLQQFFKWGVKKVEQIESILLSKIKAGKKVKLVSIDAGRGLSSRLASMGLLPNEEITVVSNAHPGPFVVSVKDSRIILGREMTQKIMVRQSKPSLKPSGEPQGITK